MGGCCGAMKTGQKSLPDKKKSADANQEKPNGKEAAQVAVSANDTGKASVDGETHAKGKPRDVEGQASQQIAAPVKVSVSHVEPVHDTAEPPVQATENVMDLETAVAPFESLPSSGDQSQQEAQGSITSAEPEVLLPFQIPVQHTFTTTTNTATTVRQEETREEFKLRVEEPQLDAAFSGDVQLSITENVQALPSEEASVPGEVEVLSKTHIEVEAAPEPLPASDVEVLAKSFAVTEVEAAPEPLPASDVEVLAKSFAVTEVEEAPEPLPASDLEVLAKSFAVTEVEEAPEPLPASDVEVLAKSFAVTEVEAAPEPIPASDLEVFAKSFAVTEVEAAPEPLPASDVEVLAKSFAAAEVEVAPEPVPSVRVEAEFEETATRVDSATPEAHLQLEEDLPPPPPVEAPQPEELEAGGRFEVDASLPVPAPLELPSESEPVPEAIIAICPPSFGDIPYVHVDTVEQSKPVEEVTPVDLPEYSPQEEVPVDLGAQTVPEELKEEQELVQNEPEHLQESAPISVQEPLSFEEAAESVPVPLQEVAPAEQTNFQDQVPAVLELGSKLGEGPLISAQDDLPPPVAEEPAKYDLESRDAIDAQAEQLPQPHVEEAVGSAELVLPSFTEKEQLVEQDLPRDVVAVQEPPQPEIATDAEIETTVSKQIAAEEEVVSSAIEAPEDISQTSQAQQVEVLPPAVSQELTEEAPTQETQEVSPPEELPSVEQQPVNFEGVAEEQLSVVQPVSSEPVFHQEPVGATSQEKVEPVSSEQAEPEGKVPETEQLVEGSVDNKSAEIVAADAPSEDQRPAEEPAPHVEQQPGEPESLQEQHQEEPAPYQEQQFEVPAAYQEQQPHEPTSQQEQQPQEPTSQQEQQPQEPAPYQELQPEESASQPEQQLQEPAFQEIPGTVEEADDAVQSLIQEQQQPQETSEPLPVLEVVSEQSQQSRHSWWNERGQEQNGQHTTTEDVPVLELVSEQVREARQIWWDQSGAQEASQPEESVNSLLETTIQPPTKQGSLIEEPSSIPSSEETAPFETEETVTPNTDGSLLPDVTSESVPSSFNDVGNQQESEIVPATKELPIVESPLSADESSTVPTENGEVDVSTQSSDETSVSILSPEGIDDPATAAAAAATKEPIPAQA